MALKNYLFFRRLPPPPKGEWGGLEKLMYDWFERIPTNEVAVWVIVTSGWKERFLLEAKKRQLAIHVVEQPFSYFTRGIIQRFWDMFNFLGEYKADGIVFFQANFEEFGLPEVLAARLRAGQLIFMHENLGSREPGQNPQKKYLGFIPSLNLWWHYQRFLINQRSRIARILVVSHEIKNRYIDWWGYYEPNVLVTYHGINTQQYIASAETRQKIRQRLNIGEDQLIVITTGRFTEQKRPERAIEAFIKTTSHFPNLHLVMAGEGPLKRNMEDLALSLECRQRIHFLGLVDHPAEYLQAADIFMLSSDNEGLSLALLEAMATGLVCISTDCTGSSEAITSAEFGFIVPKNADALAQALTQAINLGPAGRKQLGKRAAVFVQTHFDINNNVEKIFKILNVT